MILEERKDIPRWEWYYQASTLWNVRWLDRYITWQGRARFIKWKTLKQHLSDGYWSLSLCRNGKPEVFKTHTLLCRTFIPNPENRKEVNHKNGIRNDKRLENLERCTHAENITHSYRVLWQRPWMLWVKWKDNPLSKPIYQFTKEWKLLKRRDTGIDIQNRLWFHKGNIAMVCRWERNQANWYIWKYKPF